MHARSTTVQADRQRIDDGIAYIRDEVMPAVTSMPGCMGLSMLCDRDSGRCIVTTSWDSEESMSASREAVRAMREQSADRMGGQSDVQEWEIAVLHRERPAGDGAGAQVTWARIAPNHVDELLDAYRINLMPKLQQLPGFCSLSMLVDRKQGRTVSVTTFETREALDLVRRHARSLREQFARAMGAKIVDVAEMDLALAHLHAPATI